MALTAAWTVAALHVSAGLGSKYDWTVIDWGAWREGIRFGWKPLYNSPLGIVRHIVRLVHDTEDDLWLALVLGGQQLPKAGELISAQCYQKLDIGSTAAQPATHLIVGRPTLTDDLPVPAGIVVDIDHHVRAGLERGLDEVVVRRKECGIERGGGDFVADKVLPSNGEADARFSER